LKYHGLKNKKLRLPYHDSISVCVKELTTTATVDFSSQRAEDTIEINGVVAKGMEAHRVTVVVDALRKLKKTREHAKIVSKNNLEKAKGVGFSAAAFASIALAANNALNLKIDVRRLSEIARLGAGSASRSLVGGFSIWYANKNGRSWAKQLDDGTRVKLAMGIVPLASSVRTDVAHEESTSSPFFTARVKTVKATIPKMVHAIRVGDLAEVCRIAEADSLSLHAVTMTGRQGLVLVAPETIGVIQRVRTLREEKGIPVWYSMDTGPSVFLNTQPEYLDKVCDDIEGNVNIPVIRSGVGGAAYAIDQHLF
jgi:diphosphomevalonate decarboxylase